MFHGVTKANLGGLFHFVVFFTDRRKCSTAARSDVYLIKVANLAVECSMSYLRNFKRDNT